MLMHFINKEAKNYGISLTKKVRGKRIKLRKYELMSKIHKSQLRELLSLIALCKKLNIKPRFDVARKSQPPSPVRKSPVRKSQPPSPVRKSPVRKSPVRKSPVRKSPPPPPPPPVRKQPPPPPPPPVRKVGINKQANLMNALKKNLIRRGLREKLN
jgi:hypothetical protein